MDSPQPWNLWVAKYLYLQCKFSAKPTLKASQLANLILVLFQNTQSTLLFNENIILKAYYDAVTFLSIT